MYLFIYLLFISATKYSFQDFVLIIRFSAVPRTVPRAYQVLNKYLFHKRMKGKIIMSLRASPMQEEQM